MEKTHPSPHFHPLMRPSQGHGDSGEGRNPEGWGEGVVALELVPSLGRTARSRKLQRPTDHHFHTFVCRRKPACAIAMKACPGLRSGIDRSSGHSFAIRGIPSPIRPPIRHSYENLPFNQPRCRPSTGETCRIVDRWSMAE